MSESQTKAGNQKKFEKFKKFENLKFLKTRSSSRYAALLLGPCRAGTLASRAGGPSATLIDPQEWFVSSRLICCHLDWLTCMIGKTEPTKSFWLFIFCLLSTFLSILHCRQNIQVTQRTEIGILLLAIHSSKVLDYLETVESTLLVCSPCILYLVPCNHL